MNVIYVIYVNSDTVEGRGPIVLDKESGFFTSEEAAWKHADTIGGIMGRRPSSGSWKTEKFSDVEVRPIYKHDPQYGIKKAELESKINNMQSELQALKIKLRK